MSFRELARAIDVAFGRWDFGHLHHFLFADGAEVVPLEWWDETSGEELDDAGTSLARLKGGEQFAYEFDLGDGWEHLCTVANQRVDPVDMYGAVPDGIVVVDGWGSLPDQYGRRWADDDGDDDSSPEPPVDPTADLPPLLGMWGHGSSVEATDAPWVAGGGGASLPWDGDAWRQLRAAVYQRDGNTVVEVLRRRGALLRGVRAGEGLLLGCKQTIPDAFAFARLLARQLRERLEPGDLELADQLEVVMQAQPEVLRPLSVDLADVAMHLQGDDLMGGWRIDIQTGRWWPDDPSGMMGEEPPSYWEDDDRWLDVDSWGPHEAWQDMSQFIEGIDDAGLAERLRDAIEGRGAFRRFKDLVHATEDLGRSWQRFSDERERGSWPVSETSAEMAGITTQVMGCSRGGACGCAQVVAGVLV
jgi:hypothetical protein